MLDKTDHASLFVVQPVRFLYLLKLVDIAGADGVSVANAIHSAGRPGFVASRISKIARRVSPLSRANAGL
jgi:hypothetical protein